MTDNLSHLTLFGSGPKARLAPRCQALSKQTRRQCLRSAVRGKTNCRFHGGLSTGPTSPQGRQRCAKAKTFHGTETRALRASHKAFTRRLAILVELGRLCGAFPPKRSR